MQQRVSRVDPLSAAMMSAAEAAVGGLIWGIIEVVDAVVSEGPIGAGVGSFVASVVFVMILSPIFGFIGGLIGAAIYNYAASITGGLRIELADVKSQSQRKSQSQGATWGSDSD